MRKADPILTARATELEAADLILRSLSAKMIDTLFERDRYYVSLHLNAAKLRANLSECDAIASRTQPISSSMPDGHVLRIDEFLLPSS